MKYYIDLEGENDKIFKSCHDVLVRFKSNGIGFYLTPENKFRIVFDLEYMEVISNLFSDNSSGVFMVPKTDKYIAVRRKRLKSRKQKIMRYSKRHPEVKNVSELYQNYIDTDSSYFKFKIRSNSTKQSYNYCFTQTLVYDYVEGEFNSFGISKTATIPYF